MIERKNLKSNEIKEKIYLEMQDRVSGYETRGYNYYVPGFESAIELEIDNLGIEIDITSLFDLGVKTHYGDFIRVWANNRSTEYNLYYFKYDLVTQTKIFQELLKTLEEIKQELIIFTSSLLNELEDDEDYEDNIDYIIERIEGFISQQY